MALRSFRVSAARSAARALASFTSSFAARSRAAPSEEVSLIEDPPASDGNVTVAVKGGRVRGRRSGGVVAFGGIPYAEAPVGALRFERPVPRRPWDGVLDRTGPAPGAPQKPGSLARLIGMSCPTQDEDCLHVSVWTPSCDPSAARPVLFWIHGGGFEVGSASNPLADGARVAARGDVVVVSVSYRLGVLGFLRLEGAPANRGLLDQAAALAWVRDNVRAFGGDPGNVTIFGSSAGATSVTALLATQGKSGLFHRAIVQSGTAEAIGTPEVESAARRELLVQLDTPARTPAEIRALLEATPIDELLSAQAATSEHLRREGVVVPVFQLAIDPETLPRVPLAAIQAGSAPGIDLFVGTNKDELRLWSLGEDPPRMADREDFTRQVATFLGGPYADGPMRARIDTAAQRVTASYAAMRPDASYTDLFFDLATDVHFRLPALRLATAQARHGRVFAYMLAWCVPILGGSLGTPHAAEIPFLFGTHRHPRMMFFLGTGSDRDLLSDRMQEIWAAFARRGDPSVEGFAWPAFDPHDRATGIIDHALSVASPAFEEETRAWASVWRELYAVDGIDTSLSIRPVGASIPPPQLSIDQGAPSIPPPSPFASLSIPPLSPLASSLAAHEELAAEAGSEAPMLAAQGIALLSSLPLSLPRIEEFAAPSSSSLPNIASSLPPPSPAACEDPR